MAQVITENVDNIPKITPYVFEVVLNEISLRLVDISQWTYMHVYLYGTWKNNKSICDWI